MFDQSGAVADGDDFDGVRGEPVDDPISLVDLFPGFLVAVFWDDAAATGSSGLI